MNKSEIKKRVKADDKLVMADMPAMVFILERLAKKLKAQQNFTLTILGRDEKGQIKSALIQSLAVEVST